MNAFKRFGNHRLDAEQQRPFCRPIARRTGAVFFARENDERNVILFINLRGVEKGMFCIVEKIQRERTLFAAEQLIFDANVRKGAARHHFIIPAPRAVLIEIVWRDIVLFEPFRGRTPFGDAARRRNVVGGDAVAEHAQHARVVNFLQRRERHFQIIKERRIGNIRRTFAPFVQFAARCGNRVPHRIAVEHIAVRFFKHLRVHCVGNRLRDFLLRGPNVAQENILAIFSNAERFSFQINVRRAGERVGDDERRRCEKICFDVRMHAPFKIAIARKHRRRDEIARVDGFSHRFGQRTRIADAGRAAVTDNIETKLFEIRQQSRFREIFMHHFGTGRHARFHVRLYLQTFLHRFFSDETRAHHHGRIARVRA